MATPIWCEIVCRTCNNVGAGRFVFNGSIPIREMRKESGFVFKHDECFCNAKCLSQYEQENRI